MSDRKPDGDSAAAFDHKAWAAAPSQADREAAREGLRGRRSVATLTRQLRATEMELEAERAARELLLVFKDTPSRVHTLQRHKHQRATQLVTVSMLSDLHVDERVDPGTINGLNAFDMAEADRRLGYYWHSVVKLVQKEQKASSIRTHVLWVGGDLFSGHIHEDLVESTAMAPIESCFWIYPRIAAGIKLLVEELDIDELIVVWQYGNHGRDGKKPRIATAAQHNYEWMLGQFMQRELAQAAWAKKVRFIAERGALTYLDLGGYVIRFHHGDKIQFQGGIGGLTIPLNKAIAQWNKAQHADLDVLGHWHQEMDLPHAIVNGSLVGYGAYALSIKAGFELPKQGFFNVDLARKMKTGYFTVHVQPREAAA